MIEYVDLFNTLQGEGLHVGQQAIFLRLARCNLKCSFCDTSYNEGIISISEHDIAIKILKMASDEVEESVLNLVITGGEPLLQDLDPLFVKLKKLAVEKHKRVYKFNFFLETNGLLFKPWLHSCTVTISPKTPVSKLNQTTLAQARVLKFLWGQDYPKFFENLPDTVLKDPYKHLMIQPIDDEYLGINTGEVIEYCKRHPRFRLSLQIHKELGIK